MRVSLWMLIVLFFATACGSTPPSSGTTLDTFGRLSNIVRTITATHSADKTVWGAPAILDRCVDRLNTDPHPSAFEIFSEFTDYYLDTGPGSRHKLPVTILDYLSSVCFLLWQDTRHHALPWTHASAYTTDTLWVRGMFPPTLENTPYMVGYHDFAPVGFNDPVALLDAYSFGLKHVRSTKQATVEALLTWTKAHTAYTGVRPDDNAPIYSPFVRTLATRAGRHAPTLAWYLKTILFTLRIPAVVLYHTPTERHYVWLPEEDLIVDLRQIVEIPAAPSTSGLVTAQVITDGSTYSRAFRAFGRVNSPLTATKIYGDISLSGYTLFMRGVPWNDLNDLERTILVRDFPQHIDTLGNRRVVIPLSYAQSVDPLVPLEP